MSPRRDSRTHRKMNSINAKERLYKKLTEEKKHTQEWKEYNEAQTREKLMFYKLIDELLNVIPNRTYTFGRPRKSLRDMIFCSLIKIYCNTSSRRIISDLELAKKAGYIQDVPHFNTLLNYFDDAGMNMVLNYLITLSALPLKHIEDSFAVDSTGFGSGRFDRWISEKYGKTKIKNTRGFLKAHACVGTRTNIVTALRVTREKSGDSPQFSELVSETGENFLMKEISADKAYSSRDNLELARSLGAIPYIPFKKHTTGHSRGSPTWAEMYRVFTTDYLEFAKHYHKRSNIESTFAMIKRKFGDYCRCKSERSQVNEILCKVLTHNIVCLIHEIFELNLEVDFNGIAKNLPAQKVI